MVSTPDNVTGTYFMITIYGVEDEMITLHRNGKYLTTLYADCPEQANDFLKKYVNTSLATKDEWLDALQTFADAWTSKYPEND